MNGIGYLRQPVRVPMQSIATYAAAEEGKINANGLADRLSVSNSPQLTTGYACTGNVSAELFVDSLQVSDPISYKPLGPTLFFTDLLQSLISLGGSAIDPKLGFPT